MAADDALVGHGLTTMFVREPSSKTTMKNKVIIRKGEGKDYDYSQDHCYVKVSSASTGGELCVVEDELKPGFHLPRHHHKIMTEVFYILAGEVELAFDDGLVVLKPGDTITVPPNVWHEANCKHGGSMITIFKNGRFDEYLERLSSMSDNDFADKELMKSVSTEFDIYEDTAKRSD